MGVKASKTTPKSELNRSKSFSSFGRSSQRSLFQKSKARLNQINKKLKKYEEKDGPEIKKQLESIEKELNEISKAIKEKNKEKYEEILKRFQETQQEFEGKTKPEENSNNQQEPSTPQVELEQPSLVNVVPNEEQTVELRRASTPEDDVPRSPKVKFGIQVMPVNPRVSQELLKRKTLPINEAPKAEFLHIRKRAQSDQVNTENELYNFILPKEDEVIKTNSLDNFKPSDQTTPPSKSPLKELEKRQVNVPALQEIELISHDIDVLEERLKYFHGTKGDVEYLELNERFLKDLLQLDSLDPQGDPVVKQERKISLHRLQELIKILECLAKEPNQEEEEDEYQLVDNRLEEVVNAEGKPITATAL